MNSPKPTRRIWVRGCAALGGFSALSAVLGWLFGFDETAGLLALAAIILCALALQLTVQLKSFAFGAWVLACSCAGIFFPEWFGEWGGFPVKSLILPFTQLIMFGMGATLHLGDFRRVLAMPRPVTVGAGLQFVVMPCVGWGLATAFAFPSEIGAGVILIGACSGGMASNVMTYVARGNVALSVTMTACSTLLAPIMTPLAMKLLAGRFVVVDFADMMMGVMRLVVVPVALGLVVNALLRSRRWVIEKALPGLSVILVCVTLALIAAQVRDGLFKAGVALLAAACLHNLVGLLAGYQGARLARLGERECRTVSLEVGLQNGGMGIGLALGVLHSPEAAIASGVFAVWMNFSGALLASWWRRREPVEQL